MWRAQTPIKESERTDHWLIMAESLTHQPARAPPPHDGKTPQPARHLETTSVESGSFFLVNKPLYPTALHFQCSHHQIHNVVSSFKYITLDPWLFGWCSCPPRLGGGHSAWCRGHYVLDGFGDYRCGCCYRESEPVHFTNCIMLIQVADIHVHGQSTASPSSTT